MNNEMVLTELGLGSLIESSKESAPGVNAKLEQSSPYPPVLDDLVSLHRLIQKTSRTTILELGCGWSSVLFAASLRKVQEEVGDLSGYRRNNPYECHSVDNLKKYIEIAKSRIERPLEKYVIFHLSAVKMTTWNGRIATEYEKLPLVNPDLIYLDAPDQFSVEGEVNGWSTGHKDMMPMACDLLKIEHFLTPKTIIVIDGRTANARFIKSNLQRNWDYKHCPDRDQHFFLLDEKPLGKYSEKIIDEIYFRSGEWNIDDL